MSLWGGLCAGEHLVEKVNACGHDAVGVGRFAFVQKNEVGAALAVVQVSLQTVFPLYLIKKAAHRFAVGVN